MLHVNLHCQLSVKMNPEIADCGLWCNGIIAELNVIDTDLRKLLLLQQLLSCVSDKLDKQQFGALKGRSTTHALIDIVHKWNAAPDDGSSVHAVFVDYLKAFDHVDHSILLAKLISLGVPAYIIKWMYSFLDKRQQRVKIGNIFSSWLLLNVGMAQGTWLGPLTFVILIDGLRLGCLVHKSVDDTTASEILKRNQISNMVNIIFKAACRLFRIEQYEH